MKNRMKSMAKGTSSAPTVRVVSSPPPAASPCTSTRDRGSENAAANLVSPSREYESTSSNSGPVLPKESGYSSSCTNVTSVDCRNSGGIRSVSYTHLRAHETDSYLVCRLLLEK